MNRFKRAELHYLLALGLMGVFLAAVFVPNSALESLRWLAPILAMSLVYVVLNQIKKRTFLSGFALGVGFFSVHTSRAITSAGKVPWLIFFLGESAYLGLFSMVYVQLRKPFKRIRYRAPIFAFLWVGFELIRASFPLGGFPWGRLGFSQLGGPLADLAAIGGVSLVSFVVVLCAVLLVEAISFSRHREVRSASYAICAIMSILGISLIADFYQGSGGSSGQYTMTVIQGNVPEPGVNSFGNQYEVLGNHVDQTIMAAQTSTPDLYIWPENAADVDPRSYPRAEHLVDKALEAANAPILVGAVRYTEDARYNEILVWDPNLGITDVYTKQHPVPFGEYIPLRSVARLFSSEVDKITNEMLPGEGIGLLKIPTADGEVLAAVGICFEVAYDEIIRQGVDAGGEFIVIPTNAASFGWTEESEQQLAMARMRAIEHGRFTIQASTVGVSAVINSEGQVVDALPLFTAGTITQEITLRNDKTLATQYGDFVEKMFLVPSLGLIIVAGVLRVRRNSRESGAS